MTSPEVSIVLLSASANETYYKETEHYAHYEYNCKRGVDQAMAQD
jgi:hypothetical protein